MDRVAELPVVNVEPIADVLRRIARLIPDDANHAWAYNPRDDQPLGGFPSARTNLIQKPSIARPGPDGASPYLFTIQTESLVRQEAGEIEPVKVRPR
jgi:hypothetical protein